ncbi:hypothetical protein ACFCZ3_19850 [Cellulosimicrobium cellulans]|uniref:hypothetical protein n=1 Tax=Cellulosimicrobium cellulans TaxID=1710 RepID=UPI0035DA3797
MALGDVVVPKQEFDFIAIWPVVETGSPHAKPTSFLADLFDEAKERLPVVARTHRARLLERPQFAIRPANEVPGSGGTGYVIVAGAAAEPIPRPAK